VKEAHALLTEYLINDRGTIPLHLENGVHRCTVYLVRARHWISDSCLTSTLAKLRLGDFSDSGRAEQGKVRRLRWVSAQQLLSNRLPHKLYDRPALATGLHARLRELLTRPAPESLPASRQLATSLPIASSFGPDSSVSRRSSSGASSPSPPRYVEERLNGLGHGHSHSSEGKGSHPGTVVALFAFPLIMALIFAVVFGFPALIQHAGWMAALLVVGLVLLLCARIARVHRQRSALYDERARRRQAAFSAMAERTETPLTE